MSPEALAQARALARIIADEVRDISVPSVALAAIVGLCEILGVSVSGDGDDVAPD